MPSPDLVREWLDEVPDPEVPVVSVVELGVIREIRAEGETLVVAIAPTYSGCPATAVIDLMVAEKLAEKGVENYRLERRLSPPWTTDWIAESAREKLRAFGIAPPVADPGAGLTPAARALRMAGATPVVACPRCGASDAEEISRFGSTPCKAAWRCRACAEPFDYFKCH